MTDQKDQGATAPTSSIANYSLDQILDYFQYILDLVKDEYDMNIFTPEEFFADGLCD